MVTSAKSKSLYFSSGGGCGSFLMTCSCSLAAESLESVGWWELSGFGYLPNLVTAYVSVNKQNSKLTLILDVRTQLCVLPLHALVLFNQTDVPQVTFGYAAGFRSRSMMARTRPRTVGPSSSPIRVLLVLAPTRPTSGRLTPAASAAKWRHSASRRRPRAASAANRYGPRRANWSPNRGGTAGSTGRW